MVGGLLCVSPLLLPTLLPVRTHPHPWGTPGLRCLLGIPVTLLPAPQVPRAQTQRLPSAPSLCVPRLCSDTAIPPGTELRVWFPTSQAPQQPRRWVRARSLGFLPAPLPRHPLVWRPNLTCTPTFRHTGLAAPDSLIPSPESPFLNTTAIHSNYTYYSKPTQSYLLSRAVGKLDPQEKQSPRSHTPPSHRCF